MSTGIRISKENINVLTAPGKDLSYNSDNNTFKVHMSGTVQLTLTNSFGPEVNSVTVTHNLGYRPAFFIYANNYGDGSSEDYGRRPNAHSATFESIYAISKENTLEIKIREDFSITNQTFNVKYFIMADKLL